MKEKVILLLKDKDLTCSQLKSLTGFKLNDLGKILQDLLEENAIKKNNNKVYSLND